MVGVLVVAEAALAGSPELWVREFAAVAGQPTGVMGELAAEVRAPVLRYGGVAFNGTFVGAGARLAVTPVHAEGALRLSAQPIDLLPVTVEVFRGQYWESPWGFVPATSVGHQRTRDRAPYYEADRDFAATVWGASVSPTLQARLGPIAGFTNPTWTWLSVSPSPDPEPWMFEPYRGLVIADHDRLFEHTSALLWELADGEDAPIVRFGPILRGKASHATGDRTLNLGGVLQWRPGRQAHDATLMLLVAPYLEDPDFVGPVPMVAAVVTIEQWFALGPR
ncbi:MAG: hypothetical protein R3F59_01665 [Myxococcota bacterium]